MSAESGGGTAADAVWRPRRNPWLIAVVVALAAFMEVLDTSIANVALPYIAGSMSASNDQSTWVLTSYLVSNAIVLPVSGWLVSVVGRKRFFMVSILVFTVSSFFCGIASSLAVLLVSRVLQGGAGGGLQPMAQAILADTFPPAKRGTAFALYGITAVMAPIVGPTLGGWITDNYSWRWIFYINIPIGILAIFMARTFIEDPPYIRNQRPGRIDYVGFGLMALALGTLQLVLDKGQEDEWFASNFITGAVVVSLIAVIAFVIWELRSKEPIVDLRVLLNRNFAVGTSLMIVMGIVLYGTIALLPLFLQTLMGYPAVSSGMAVSPRGFGAIVSMLIVGRLIGKVPSRYLIIFGFSVLGYSTYLFSKINLEISISSIVYPSIISGFAMGFIFVPLTTMALGTLSNEQMGNASGVFNLMRNTGGSVGIATVTTMLARGAQVHQAAMVSHLSPYDPAFQERIKQLSQGFAARSGSVMAKSDGVF